MSGYVACGDEIPCAFMFCITTQEQEIQPPPCHCFATSPTRLRTILKTSSAYVITFML